MTRFKGSCVVRVYQVYVGSSKTITLSVEKSWLPNLPLKIHTLTNMRRWLAMSHCQKKQIKMSLIVVLSTTWGYQSPSCPHTTLTETNPQLVNSQPRDTLSVVKSFTKLQNDNFSLVIPLRVTSSSIMRCDCALMCLSYLSWLSAYCHLCIRQPC